MAKASSEVESDVQKTREARFYRFLLKRSNGPFLQSEYIPTLQVRRVNGRFSGEETLMSVKQMPELGQAYIAG